jgi:hypothetical protein
MCTLTSSYSSQINRLPVAQHFTNKIRKMESSVKMECCGYGPAHLSLSTVALLPATRRRSATVQATGTAALVDRSSWAWHGGQRRAQRRAALRAMLLCRAPQRRNYIRRRLPLTVTAPPASLALAVVTPALHRAASGLPCASRRDTEMASVLYRFSIYINIIA